MNPEEAPLSLLQVPQSDTFQCRHHQLCPHGLPSRAPQRRRHYLRHGHPDGLVRRRTHGWYHRQLYAGHARYSVLVESGKEE